MLPSEWKTTWRVLDSVSSHVSVLDPRGRIVHVNNAWTDFARQNRPKGRKLLHTGIGANYLNVLKLAKGKNSEEAKPALKGIQDVINGKKKKFTLEYPCHSKVEKRWFTMTVLPLPRGKETWAVVTHHNITESKLLELARRKNLEVQKKYAAKLEQAVSNKTAQLRKALSKERDLKRFKTQFIVNVSHEFRTPLTIIKLALSFIKRFQGSFDKTQMDQQFLSIDKQIVQITSILDEMLMIGRANMVSVSQIELVPFLKNVIKQTESEWPTHRVTAKFDIPQKNIFTDPALLQKIVTNLLHNAIKFSPVADQILFNVFTADSKLVMEITDFGIGIPKKSEALIFKPFYKGVNAQSIEGHGLGLTIVKRAVQLLGGRIQFKSDKTHGTTFKVALPLNKK